MQQTCVDGVPVFWVEGPPPMSAVLLFRVGIRDEPFVRRGVTHLVEHLTMSRAGRSRGHDVNASVSTAITTFEATGPAEAVADYLADVCTALHDLPLDRLETEQKVVAVEAEQAAGIEELHLLLRYGLRGPGLAGADPPAPGTPDAGYVQDWANRHFPRSAAVLALAGPFPTSLRLPLPDWQPPVRTEVAEVPRDGPTWTEHPDDRGIAVSFRVPDGEAAAAGARIAHARLTDELRHRLGLVYDVDHILTASAAGDADLLTLIADPPARSAGQAAAVLDRVLRELCRTGPSDGELAADLVAGQAAREDPRAALDIAVRAAQEHLASGRPWDVDAALAEQAQLRPADVAAALAGYPGTAILTVPEGVEPQLDGFTRYPEHAGDPVTGQVFKRQMFGPVPRGGSLVVGDDGVSAVQRNGTATIRWDDVVGYGENPDGLRTLYGGDGCVIDLHPLFFRHGEYALALVEARVPPEVRFTHQPPPDHELQTPRRRRARRTP